MPRILIVSTLWLSQHYDCLTLTLPKPNMSYIVVVSPLWLSHPNSTYYKLGFTMISLLIISQNFECPINILLAQTKDLYKIQKQSEDTTEKIYLIFFINAFAIWTKCIIYLILFYISIKNVSKLIHRFLLSHQHFV